MNAENTRGPATQETLKSAVDRCREVVRLAPGDADAHTALGKALQLWGQVARRPGRAGAEQANWTSGF